MDFKKCYLMGILNVTKDSFFDGNKYFEKNKAIEHGLELIDQGADILDIGGESTKPKSIKISSEEEINRIIDVIAGIKKYTNVPISVDTYKKSVAEEALKVGVDIINDVYGGIYDKSMFDLAKKYNCYICITHNRLKNVNNYNNVVDETYTELEKAYKKALNIGVKKEKIILDPGLGFSKYGEKNIEILRNINKFKNFNLPLLVGVSRKKFLHLLDNLDPITSAVSTLSANFYLASLGINILRIHDVKEHRRIIDIINELVWREKIE